MAEDDVPRATGGPDQHRIDKRVEIIATIVLGLATLASAWGAYQATRWGGVQATAYTEAQLKSTDAAKSFQLADSTLGLDQTLFVQWAVADTNGDTDFADYVYQTLGSQEFTDAMDAWIASDFEADTPFALEEYTQEALDDAFAFEDEAAIENEIGRDANQTGDDYVLVTVVLTSALFFAGMSVVLTTERVRYAMLSLGGVLLLAGSILMATFPVE